MNFHVATGREIIEVAAPRCKLRVPSGFLDGLLCARKFVQQGPLVFPWVQYVYLLEGKLYASDNHCIIEIDLGNPAFGAARFSVGDVAVLKSFGADPHRAKCADGKTTFTWKGGQWCQFHGDLAGMELAVQSRRLLDENWREAQELDAARRSAILGLAERATGNEAICFAADITGLDHDCYWYAGMISKIMSIATSLYADDGVNSFTFPNGRGLFVNAPGPSIE